MSRFAWLTKTGGPSGLRALGWLAVAYAVAVTVAFVVGAFVHAAGGSASPWLWGLLPGPWAEDLAAGWNRGPGPRAFVLGALWATGVVAAFTAVIVAGWIHAGWNARPRTAARPVLGVLAAVLVLVGGIDTAAALWHGLDGDWHGLDPFGPFAVLVGVWLAVSAAKGPRAAAAGGPGAPAAAPPRPSQVAAGAERSAASARARTPHKATQFVQGRPLRRDEMRRR